MDIKLTIGFDQLLNLTSQLSEAEKKKLMSALQSSNATDQHGERELGKYKGQIWMSDDFNEPLDDFKDYM